MKAIIDHTTKRITLPTQTRVRLVNGNYDVTIYPEKTFGSRAQFDGWINRECKLLDDADEAEVRAQFERAAQLRGEP